MRSSCRLCLRLTARAVQKSLSLPAINFADIAKNPTRYFDNASKRGANISLTDIFKISDLYKERRRLYLSLQEAKSKQASAGKATAKATSDEAKEAARASAIALRNQVKSVMSEISRVEADMDTLSWHLPNFTHPDAPNGGYDACKVVRTFGTKDEVDAPDPFRDHVRVTEALGWANFAAGASTTGARWPFLTNEGALLELALINHAVSAVSAKGFQMIVPPDVVKTELAHRCGFRPRDDEASQTYHVSTSDHSAEDQGLVLAGTAEIPLAGYCMQTTFDENQLPLRYMALGRAFRAEAGSRGKESKGLYRVHQFSKVEMFVVCAEEEGEEMLELLVAQQEAILNGLGLPTRTLDMSTRELGASAYRKYDVEAWMPGRGSWGELSSASLCTDYQSRQLNIRYRSRKRNPSDKGKASTPFAYTLNATAAAIPRLIVALVENGARLDPSTQQLRVELPRSLQRHWLGPCDDVGVKNRDGVYVIRWR